VVSIRKRTRLIHLSRFPATTKQTTRWFLAELHFCCQLNDSEFLVDGASYLGSALDEDGHRFQAMSNGDRNAIECFFCEIERRPSSFANSYSQVTLETAQPWLEAFAVYYNSRQNSRNRERH
jgi:transposase-like protein